MMLSALCDIDQTSWLKIFKEKILLSFENDESFLHFRRSPQYKEYFPFTH